jgi:hypothetical protein
MVTMNLQQGPVSAITDLRQFINQFNLELDETVEAVFYRAEELALSQDKALHSWTFLASAIEIIKPLRSTMIKLGGDPNRGLIAVLEVVKGNVHDDPYGLEDGYPYSSKESRELFARTLLIDLAISIAKRNHHSEISIYDFMGALLDCHDQLFPIYENNSWTDEALHTPFNTLSHVIGHYKPTLWVRFDDLRKELGLLGGTSPAESAPPEVRVSVLELLDEYPNYDKNCFIIMPFRNTPVHANIYKVISETLSELGFNALRADMKSFSDDLFLNILTYLHGCKFGISVFERVLSDDFNPNVSLEVGYLLGLRKPVLLLKDQTLPRLPSDLVGRLYTEFNTLNIKKTLPQGIRAWLLNKQLIRDEKRKLI